MTLVDDVVTVAPPLPAAAPVPDGTECPGTFRGSCQRCGTLMHLRTSVSRRCTVGHPRYGGRGCCTVCYQLAYDRHDLPTVVLLRLANPGRRVCAPSTRVAGTRPAPRPATRPVPPPPPPPGATLIPEDRRSTMWAPCTRCGLIAQLPLGPGDALCPPCDRAQTRDLAARRGPRTRP